MLLAGTIVVALCLSLCADPPDPFNPWKFETIRLRTGKLFKGLVVRETALSVTMECVQQKPGELTRVFTSTFQRAEIAGIERLDPKERELLTARLKALVPANEKLRIESLKLIPVPWGNAENGGLSYRSDHFMLLSNAREWIVRKAAVRLDQVYAAYVRLLPPRRAMADPTSIRLVRSMDEYRELLRGQARNLLNPAYYDAAGNQIVCASELEKLHEELGRLRALHQQKLDRIKQQEAEAETHIRDKSLREKTLQKLRADREKIEKANADNEKKFERATQRLFQMLYHEAFHAYLANFVYPPGDAEVPRWLNEGLAQIFETAILEAGELRVGHADRDRLEQVQAALRKGQFVALSDLLRASPKQFLVNHGGEQRISDQYYLASWALAFYLTFERKMLGTPGLDRYVQALKVQDADPLAAFTSMVGRPLAEFEKSWHKYLLDLRPDGAAGG
jgi:hypothetical protein